MLRGLQLGHIADKFVAEAISGGDLAIATDDDLREMGVTVGPQRRRLLEINSRYAAGVPESLYAAPTTPAAVGLPPVTGGAAQASTVPARTFAASNFLRAYRDPQSRPRFQHQLFTAVHAIVRAHAALFGSSPADADDFFAQMQVTPSGPLHGIAHLVTSLPRHLVASSHARGHAERAVADRHPPLQTVTCRYVPAPR